ncbi:MAG: S1 RNA-binding domain-containing protein [Vallitaleaceae bacterium]|nr:S1 RNA-binding domain-containing protein [Vallitaleaceae bacterium]
MVEREETMDDYKDFIDQSMKRFEIGDLVDGEIISINDEEAIINFGYSSDGIVPVSETFADFDHPLSGQFQVGDRVKAEIVGRDQSNGNFLLSLKEAYQEMLWERIKDTMETGEIIETHVLDVVKGGVIIKVHQVRAFIPASMLDMNYVEDLSFFAGKTIEVRVVEIDREKNRVIASRKSVLKEQVEKSREEAMFLIRKDETYRGTVKRLMPYGAFVEIKAGVEGLVHISTLSESRIHHPSEVVKVGEEILVKVLEVDVKSKKIKLAYVNENAEREEELDLAPYHVDEPMTRNLESVFKGFLNKFDQN